MEIVVMYVGWAMVVGALVLACGLVWYYALFWIFNAIKNTYYMGVFIRFWVIAVHRKRRIEKMMRNTRKTGANTTATEGHNVK